MKPYVEMCHVLELAYKIRNSEQWDLDDCRELCYFAGLMDEWFDSDSDTFEKVVYKAAKILGVEI